MKTKIFLSAFCVFALLKIHAQNNSGYSVSVELLNFTSIIYWEGVYISGSEPMDKLVEQSSSYIFQFNRMRGVDMKSKEQFFTFGVSILYSPTTFQAPSLPKNFEYLYPAYYVRTDQLYVGLNVGFEKSLNLSKRKRNKLAPFFAVQLAGYYGVWQMQTLQSTQSGEGTFKETIAADNYFMASLQANIGVQYFFTKKHDNSVKLYLPINYTYNASKNFNSFPVLGFVGLSFDWL